MSMNFGLAKQQYTIETAKSKYGSLKIVKPLLNSSLKKLADFIKFKKNRRKQKENRGFFLHLLPGENRAGEKTLKI